MRTGRPYRAAKPLCLRRHRAGDHRNWRGAYDWTDPFDVPDSRAIYTLGADLVADAFDWPGRGGLGEWHDPWHLVRHFVGEALWPFGDTRWALRRPRSSTCSTSTATSNPSRDRFTDPRRRGRRQPGRIGRPPMLFGECSVC
jgi:hypothetical protein